MKFENDENGDTLWKLTESNAVVFLWFGQSDSNVYDRNKLVPTCITYTFTSPPWSHIFVRAPKWSFLFSTTLFNTQALNIGQA